MSQSYTEKQRASVVFPALLTVLIVLFGYFKIFEGYNFFIHEDWVALSNHTSGNKDSNGWRPDKGLGISYFYGDPGMWHPWAFLSFLEKAAPSREWALACSILAMDIAAVLAVFFFIRRFFPQINLWIAALLGPLLVFCFDAPAQHYSRHCISLTAAVPVFLWVLHDYYERPRRLHIFLSALIIWAVAFFGNLWSMTQLLTLGLIFSVLYLIYFKPDPKTHLRRFFVLYGVSVPMVVALGAWVFYSFGLEQSVTGYVREKFIPFKGLKLLPEIKPLVSYLCGLIPFEGIPIDHNLAAFQYLPYRLNASVVFIFAFLFFLGRKAESFWEFALKTLMIIFFVHGLLFYGKLIPAYGAVYEFISNNTSKLISMYMFVFSIEALLIILFVASVTPANVVVNNLWLRWLQRLIAFVTVGCYAAVFVLAFSAKFFPEHYRWMADQWIPSIIPAQIGGYSKDLLSYMFSYNAQRYAELVRPQWFVFFATSLMIAGVFLKDSWLRRAAGLPKLLIAGVLIVNAVFLSWSLYPLTNRPLAWERPEVKSLAFEPTDRFYFVRYFQWDKTVDGFKKKWEPQGAPRQNIIGYLEPPGLNISGFKSFTNKAEAEFMQRVFDEAGLDYVRLYYGANFISSDLLDMSAVNYYYSDNKIDPLPANIVPFAQFEQLYIYKNTTAWPYYYLAERLQNTQGGPVSRPVKGTAYLSDSDFFDFRRGSKEDQVRLKKFGYGHLVFDVDTKDEEFLVVADAWHPFWKARASTGKEFRIYKVNEVFKGIRLEPGQYELNFVYDTRPYQPGIWISMVAWILWGWATWQAYRDRREIVWLKGK